MPRRRGRSAIRMAVIAITIATSASTSPSDSAPAGRAAFLHERRRVDHDADRGDRGRGDAPATAMVGAALVADTPSSMAPNR